MPSIVQLYRQAYYGLSKETWYLSLVVLINRSGTMVIPFLTMYATQSLGLGVAQAGLVMSCFGAGAIIGAFLGGRLSDKAGFYNVQLGALAGGGIMYIVVGYLSTFTALAIGVFILAIINESFRPANAAAIARYSNPDSVTRSFSLNRLAINLGWAFGGSVGGFLAARNYHALFWVDGITNILAAIILYIVLPKKSTHGPKQQTTAPLAGQQFPYRDKLYLQFIALTILFAFCFFQMFSLLPIFYKTKMHLSEDQIGLLMAINGLIIAALEMVLVYNLEKQQRPLQNIMYGVWLVALSFVIFNLFNGGFLLALVSMLFITAGEMLSMPFMNTYWLSRTTETNRGQYAAFYTMAWGTSQIAAPSIGGYIAGTYNFNVLFWVLFVVAVISGWGYRYLIKQPG